METPLRSVIFLAVLAPFAAPRGSAAEDRGETKAAAKPNVLLIMADQLRWDALGCYGNRAIRTPNLDRLAEGGTRFTECWAQHPVCMPSRASIFTGRYPSVHGVRSNGIPLPEHETTLAQVFMENGWRTSGAGKFHFVPHYPYRSPLPNMATHPEPYYGFQEFHLGEDGRSGDHWAWIKENHPQFHLKPDNEIPVQLHNSHWAATHTIEFINKCAAKGEAFFAFCSFVDPHHSYNPPPPYREMYRPEEMPSPFAQPGEHKGKPDFILRTVDRYARPLEQINQLRAQYYGEVTFIDDMVGRIVEALSTSGVRDRTLIVFVADHGDLLGDHSLLYKGALHYRGCANLPLILNWPARVKAGKVVEGLVQEIDLFPTISELAGLPPTPGVQGRSQVSVLTSDSVDTEYDSVLIESAASGVNAPSYQRADVSRDVYTLRTKRWRMSYYPGLDYGELYDLQADPHEYRNLWPKPELADVRRMMKDKLLERVLAAHDPLPPRIKPY